MSDYRARYWCKSNPDGHCQLCLVYGFPPMQGSLEHLLLKCPVLAVVRAHAISHWSSYMVDKPYLLPIVTHHTVSTGTDSDQLHMELLLDPSTCPKVITAVQESGSSILCHLLYMSRTWCYAHHLKRRRLLKLNNII